MPTANRFGGAASRADHITEVSSITTPDPPACALAPQTPVFRRTQIDANSPTRPRYHDPTTHSTHDPTPWSAVTDK